MVCYNSLVLYSLRVLKHRDFRLLTLSTFLLYAARWTEVVVLGWLVLELTNSPFLVGLAASFRFVGWGLGPLGGAISDRMERRRLLLAAQTVNSATALGLLVLMVSGWLQVWQLFVAILVLGCTYAFDYPSRNALVGDIVGSQDLLNGMALNRAAQNLTAVIGPVLGGSFMLLVGYSGAYGLVAGMYLANLVVLLALCRAGTTYAREVEPIWQGLRKGFAYFLREPRIRAVLMLAALANLLAFPLTHALMPMFARDVLAVGAVGLGFLTAAVAAGALVGNLGLASLRHSRRQGWLLIIGYIMWPVMLVTFSFSQWYPLSLGILFIGGIFQDVAMVSTATLLMTSVSDEMRGRVMGMRGLAVTTLLVGNLVSGALTERYGAPFTLTVFGGLAILLMGSVLFSTPGIRRSK